jgi:Tol biopolymer transport system component
MKALVNCIISTAVLLILAGCGRGGQLNPSVYGASTAEPLPSLKSGAVNPIALPGPEVETAVLQSNPFEQPKITTSEPITLSAQITLRQLTTGGCCVKPFWSADSKHVLFVDRPTSQAPAGVWSVDLVGGEPSFQTDKLGIYSNDQTLRAFPLDGQTIIERLADDQRWAIPNNGREVVFSMDDTQVAWTAGRTQPPFDTAQRKVWVSSVDGSNAHQVLTALSAGISGWFPDGRLLINGRLDSPNLGQVLWMFSPPTNGADNWNMTELARAERLRGATLSPDGKWLAYISAFSGDPTIDGLWLENTETLEKRKMELFGGYHWRDSTHMLIVPLELEKKAHRIIQVEAPTGSILPLTDPEKTPFKIANGDWSVSPDGEWIVFVSAWDGNIWTIHLGEIK